MAPYVPGVPRLVRGYVQQSITDGLLHVRIQYVGTWTVLVYMLHVHVQDGSVLLQVQEYSIVVASIRFIVI